MDSAKSSLSSLQRFNLLWRRARDATFHFSGTLTPSTPPPHPCLRLNCLCGENLQNLKPNNLWILSAMPGYCTAVMTPAVAAISPPPPPCSAAQTCHRSKHWKYPRGLQQRPNFSRPIAGRLIELSFIPSGQRRKTIKRLFFTKRLKMSDT